MTQSTLSTSMVVVCAICVQIVACTARMNCCITFCSSALGTYSSALETYWRMVTLPHLQVTTTLSMLLYTIKLMPALYYARSWCGSDGPHNIPVSERKL
jgi:hypothetical protein